MDNKLKTKQAGASYKLQPTEIDCDCHFKQVERDRNVSAAVGIDHCRFSYVANAPAKIDHDLAAAPSYYILKIDLHFIWL